MFIYENCSEENRVGLILCEFCGQRVTQSDNSKTLAGRNIQMSALLSDLDHPLSMPQKPQENAILLIIYGNRDPMTLHLITPARPYVPGRSEQVQDVDIDLESHGALHPGVSRHHASIFYNADTWWILRGSL